MNIRTFARWPLTVACAALSLLSTATLAQLAPMAGAAAAPAPAASPSSVDASSYSIGLVFGSQLYSSGLDGQVSPEAVLRGLKDGLGGKELTSADRDLAMQLMHTAREAVANRNRAAAREFLARNATEQGVMTTATGLQYEVFEAGDAKAAAPVLTDRVAVRYRGRLLNGTEFDNSDKHAQAATFGLNGVIKGWREALLLMKPGAKWRLFVPPELAYDANPPAAIPPGSLLIFEMELVKVEPPQVLSGRAGKPIVESNGSDKRAIQQAPPSAAAE